MYKMNFMPEITSYTNIIFTVITHRFSGKKIVNTYSHKIKSLNVGPWTLIEWKLHGNFKDFASQSH